MHFKFIIQKFEWINTLFAKRIHMLCQTKLCTKYNKYTEQEGYISKSL
jgi:hypothetical protein